MSAKDSVLDAVRRLPDNVSLEEIREELEIFIRLRAAEKASAEGRVTTQEVWATTPPPDPAAATAPPEGNSVAWDGREATPRGRTEE